MTELDHYNRYLKTITDLQSYINNEVLSTQIRTPDPPTILHYIKMIKVLNNVVCDIERLKDELRVR